MVKGVVFWGLLEKTSYMLKRPKERQGFVCLLLLDVGVCKWAARSPSVTVRTISQQTHAGRAERR